MYCVVTAGPTYEPLDEVRRLTNFSTGRLGTELANYLTDRGHTVTLLLGEQATHQGERRANLVETFSTTADLGKRLRRLANQPIGAVCHAAAVSDFRFGKVWVRGENNQLTELSSGKFSTRQGTLVAELVPTSKIIPQLRDWFPAAKLIGWKYEVEGTRSDVIASGRKQIGECRTDACVANGPAYGAGFGVVTGKADPQHVADQDALFAALAELLR